MSDKKFKYVKCPTFIFSLKMNEDCKGDGNDKLMLFMLMSLGENSKNYNQEQLGGMIGCSVVAAGKILKRLESNGFINIIQGKFDPKEKKRTHNTFEVNMEYIESLATDNDYFISNNNKTEEPERMIEEPITNPLNDVEDDNDFRYGEIDTTNPMVSFLREDDEPSMKDRIRENQFNTDIKEAANIILNLLRLKTPEDKIDEVFNKHTNSISMKYSKRLDYVAKEIRTKAIEIIKAA